MLLKPCTHWGFTIIAEFCANAFNFNSVVFLLNQRLVPRM
jgi:hypothetical protein